MSSIPVRFRWLRAAKDEGSATSARSFVFRPVTTAVSPQQVLGGGNWTWLGGQSSASRMTIRLVEEGDEALILNEDRRRAFVGISRVVRAAYPAPTSEEPSRLAIDLEHVRPLTPAIQFNALRAEQRLHGSALLRAPTPEMVRLTTEERRILKRLGVG